ncbi:HCP-like protein [Gigaspora margarita]|uniref:HCP-like protein n=1 Tax=Gigaspora margarita TaxID=4874 RepID=A0A8H4ERJ4_GIGMA|nr:HCP-like protein [Gigaspora margarita]
MNNSNRMYQVAHCCYLGIGVEIDKHKAFTYYLKSVKAGNAAMKSQFTNYLNWDLPDRMKQAFSHYQKLAKINNSNRIYQVAHCCYLGIGVKIDKHKAFTYYLRFAKAGNAVMESSNSPII